MTKSPKANLDLEHDKTKTSAGRARPMPFGWCQTTCDKCGKRVGANMSHYDRVSCGRCGKQYWALEPKRDKGLVLFPLPS